MSAWLESVLGKIFNSGISIPLSKGLNFASGLTAQLNPTTKQIDISNTPTQANANTLAPMLRGVGLTVDSSGKLQVRMRPRKIMLLESFSFGGTTSGNIGECNWSLTGDTPTFTRRDATFSNSTRVELETSGTTGDRATLCVGDVDARGVCSAQEVRLAQLVHNANSQTAKTFFFGLHGDFSQVPSSATNCLGFYYDVAVSPNWLLLARTGGAGSPVNTGVAMLTNSGELLSIYQVDGAYQFWSGNTLLGTISTGVPTANMNFGMSVRTTTSASKTHRFGRVVLESTIIGGAHDDDAFLEV